jgi:small subunit ribosomal protein S21
LRSRLDQGDDRVSGLAHRKRPQNSPWRALTLDAASNARAGTMTGRHRTTEGVQNLQVLVRDNNVDQALRVLKKKMQREGVFREMKRRRFYEKPSEKTTREKGEAQRRARKLARKQAVRDGLIAAPQKKRIETARSAGAPRPRPFA